MQATLLFLKRDDQVLLAYKKRGFGVDKWNGVGGKVEPDEMPAQAAARECEEEILVKPVSFHKAAEIEFRAYMDGKPVDYPIHIYLCDKWEGEPQETEEMRPQWFKLSDIPFDAMWADDIHWLPRILKGQKLRGFCAFDKDDRMIEYRFSETSEL